MAGNFELLSVENADRLDRQDKVEATRGRAAISAEARGGAGELGAAMTKADGRALAKAVKSHSKNAKAASTAADDAKADAVRLAECLQRYTRYYASKQDVLREACAGVPPNPRWSLAQAQHELDRVRAALNSSAAEFTCKRAVAYGAKGAEYVTMKLGVNPLRLDLTELGDAVSGALLDKDSPVYGFFDPEMDEMIAECGSLFTAPWQVRMAFKVSQFAQLYSAERRKRRDDGPGSPAPGEAPPAKRPRAAESGAAPAGAPSPGSA